MRASRLANPTAAEALLRTFTQQSSDPPSPDGETVQAVAFTYDSSSPVVFQTIKPGQIMNRAVLLIEEGFDDPSAVIEFGTTAEPGLFLADDESTISSPGQTENDTLYPIVATDFLILTISPGASTMGSGILLYKLK
jgi:hypothetical protein